MKTIIMQKEQIPQANFLDILFDGRNKEYGAYELRRDYDSRVLKALLVTMSLIALFILIQSFSATPKLENEVTVPENHLTEVKEEKKMEKIEIKKPESIKKQVSTIVYKTPRVTVDHEVIKPPADMETIEKSVIGDVDIKGVDFDGVIAPPAEVVGTEIIAGIDSKKKVEDSIFIKVEIEASFPGGLGAWKKYIEKMVGSQLDDFSDGDFGTCNVQFVVDKFGMVSEVVALNMKNSKLAEIAVQTIKKGPKWIPAQQNGEIVKAYRVQPITVRSPN